MNFHTQIVTCVVSADPVSVFLPGQSVSFTLTTLKATSELVIIILIMLDVSVKKI